MCLSRLIASATAALLATSIVTAIGSVFEFGHF
jgi:hypothetical protein